MTALDASEGHLIELAATGDPSAVKTLFERHRARLLHMVAVRMDPRVVQRLDASDVVQESLLEAHEKLKEYAATRPLPLYPWLRQIAWQRLMRAHERHISAQRRSVARERLSLVTLSNDSAQGLAEHVMDETTSPSGKVIRAEVQQRVRNALADMSSRDGEVLVMRYLEHMSIGEIAATLQINEHAVHMRQLRALQKLRQCLTDDDQKDPP